MNYYSILLSASTRCAGLALCLALALLLATPAQAQKEAQDQAQAQEQGKIQAQEQGKEKKTPKFKISSPQLKNKQAMSIDQVFNGFGCSGKNISPELVWKNAPEGTKSFAVTAYDPDAPTGSGWWHWVVFNIPANVHRLELGAGTADGAKLPQGAVQSVTDFGAPGFGGACPPEGDKAHRYVFTVYALNTDKLELDSKAMPALVGFMINGAKIGKAKIVGKYSR